MRAFVAVVEDGGLSAAARRLHISQPALSGTIQALEKRLDTQLLTRSSSGVTPTAAGMTFLNEARAVIARYEAALAAMAAHSPHRSRTLRIGVPLELPPQPVSEAISQLAAAYPGTTVTVRHMSTAKQLDALCRDELDVGLVRELPATDRLDVGVALREPLGVLLAAEQATAVASPSGGVHLDRLIGLQWLGFPRAGSPAWYDEITAVLRSHGIQPDRPDAYTQDLQPEVKLAQISAGGRFALAPANWQRPLPNSVRWLRLVDSPLVRRTWVVWPARSHRKDVAHLVAALEDAIEAAGPGDDARSTAPTAI